MFCFSIDGLKNGSTGRTPNWDVEKNHVSFFGDRTFACIVSTGKMSWVGRRPKVRFQRRLNRCSHFFAAALRAGRQEAAALLFPCWQSMAREHRFSQTNWGGGATPCALFWSPTHRSKRASSTSLCASARAPGGMSSLQSSH